MDLLISKKENGRCLEIGTVTELPNNHFLVGAYSFSANSVEIVRDVAFPEYGPISIWKYDAGYKPHEPSHSIFIQSRKEEYCSKIDALADQLRSALVIDGTIAHEYNLVARIAREYHASGMVDEPPIAIKSWMIASEMTKEAATADILSRANTYESLLLEIRTVRLIGKSAIGKAELYPQILTEFGEALSKLEQLARSANIVLNY